MSNFRIEPNPDDDVFGPPAPSSRPKTRTSTSGNPKDPDASPHDSLKERANADESFPEESLPHVLHHLSLPYSMQRDKSTWETIPPSPAHNPAVRIAGDLGTESPDSLERRSSPFDPPVHDIRKGEDTPGTTPDTSPDTTLPSHSQLPTARGKSSLVSPESRRRNGATTVQPSPSRSSRRPSARSIDFRGNDAMAEAARPVTPASTISSATAAQNVVAEQPGPIGEHRMNEEPATPGEIELPAALAASDNPTRNERDSLGNAGAPRPRATPRPLPLPSRNTRWVRTEVQPQPRKVRTFKSTDPAAKHRASEPTIIEDRGLGNWEAVLPNTSFPLGRGPFDAMFPPEMQSFDNRSLMHDHLKKSAEDMFVKTPDGIFPASLAPLILELGKKRPFITPTRICQLYDEGTQLVSSLKADRLARANHRSQLVRQNLQVTSGRDIYMQNRASYVGDLTEVENAGPLFHSAYGPIAPETLEVSKAHQLDGLRALILGIEKQHPQVPLPSVRELQIIARTLTRGHSATSSADNFNVDDWAPLPEVQELQAIARTVTPRHGAISSADNFNENELSLILKQWCDKNSVVLQLGVRSEARTTIYARSDGSAGETVWLHLRRDGLSNHSAIYQWSALPAPPARTTDPKDGLMRGIVRAVFDFIGLNIDLAECAYLQSSTQRSLLFSLPRFGSGAGPKGPMKRALGWAYKILDACGAALSDELKSFGEKLGLGHWGAWARDHCGGARDTILKKARDLYREVVAPAGVRLSHEWQNFCDISRELWYITSPKLPWIAPILLTLFLFWWTHDWLLPLLQDTFSDSLRHARKTTESILYALKYDIATLSETLCQFFTVVAAEIADAFVTVKNYLTELKDFVIGWLRDVHMSMKPSARASSLPKTASSSQSLQAVSKAPGSPYWPFDKPDSLGRLEALQMPQMPQMPGMPQMPHMPQIPEMPELPVIPILIVFAISGSLASAFLIIADHPHLIVYWISRVFEQTSQWFRDLLTGIMDIGTRASTSASHQLRHVQAGTAKQTRLWFHFMRSFWTLVVAWINYIWEERWNIFGDFGTSAVDAYRRLIKQVRRFPLRRALFYTNAWLLAVHTLALGVWLALWFCGICSKGSVRGSYPCNMVVNANNITQCEDVDDLRQKLSATIEELNRRQDDLYSFASIAVQPITTTVTVLARASPVPGWTLW